MATQHEIYLGTDSAEEIGDTVLQAIRSLAPIRVIGDDGEAVTYSCTDVTRPQETR